MIADNLKNCSLYFGTHPRFADAFAFIEKAIRENYGEGAYEIDGKELYASISEGNTAPQTDETFEGHRKYIDIQFLVYGAELIKVADISKLEQTTEYNAEGDYALFAGNDTASSVVLGKEDYAILFPHDLHKPGLAPNNSPAPEKKIIVKVKA